MSKPVLGSLSRKCPTHDKQSIVLVCMDVRCRQRLLCCLQCVDEQHRKHEIVSLAKFEKILGEQLQRNNNNKEKVKLMKEFKEQELHMIKSVKTIENALIAQLASIENQITRIFAQLHRTFALPSLDQLLNDLITAEDLKPWADVIDDLQLCKKYTIGTYQDTLTVLAQENDMLYSMLEEVKKEAVGKMKAVLNNVRAFNLNSVRKEEPLRFHPTYRHHQISILDNPCIVQKKGSGSRSIAVGSRPLDPVNNSVKFRVVSNGAGIPSICLGVAIFSQIKGSNMGNCIGYKKGVYCIDQASTTQWGSLSESDEATEINNDDPNNNKIGFQIEEGDEIEMYLDYQNTTLVFIKSEDDAYEMNVDCSHRDFYPFVSLNNENAMVELIN